MPRGMPIRVRLADMRVNSMGNWFWQARFIGIETDETSAKRGYVARRPNYSFAKQQKEIKRQRKKEEKAAKRLRKKELDTLDGHVDVDSAPEDPTLRADLRGATDRQRPSE